MLTAPLAAALLSLTAAAPPAKAAPKPAAAPGKAKPAGPTAAAEGDPGCVQRSLRIPDGTLVTRAGTVRLTVAIGEAGEAGQVRVPEGVPEPLAAALRTAVRACAFTPGRDAAGAAVASALSLPVRLAVTERPDAAPDRAAAGPGAPSDPAAGSDAAPVPPPAPQGQPAREEEPGCVADRFQMPPHRMLHGILTFGIPVAADGEAGRPDLPELDEDIAHELRKAVGRCRFVPAAGPDGALQAGRVTIRIRFAAPGDEARAAQAGTLSREAKLANSSCLLQLGSSSLVGHVVVSVRISEKGRPSEMKISPENTPATLRLAIFDALALCPWTPALDLNGNPVASTINFSMRYR